MTWQLFIFISILAEVFGRLLQRTLLLKNNSDPIAYSIVFQLLAGFFVGCYALSQGFSIPSNISSILPNLIVMPILWSLVNIFLFHSLKHTEASVFMVLFSTRAIWQIIGAILLLNETFAPIQFLGATLIFGSVILISGRKNKVSIKKGEMFALLSAIAFALAIINDSFVVKTFDVPSYLTFGFTLPGILIWLTHPRTTPHVIKLISNPILWKIGLLALLFATSAVTSLLAYQAGNNSAQLGAIFQVSTILTILLAIFVLKETSSIKIKFIAGVLSFIGILLIL